MPDGGGWEPSDHACRTCGGRVMSRSARGDSPSVNKCFHCGAEASGHVRAICGCGLAGGRGLYPFRCELNPTRSPSNPPIVVIVRAAPQPRRSAGAKA